MSAGSERMTREPRLSGRNEFRSSWTTTIRYLPAGKFAAKAGLSSDIIAELKTNKRPSNMAEDEALVYDFVTELTTTRKVTDETFARAKK